MKVILTIFLMTITMAGSVYDFKVKGLDGGTIDFSDFRGKKILIVNTASDCGQTPQYESLEQLYRENKDHLVVIGFPSNDFGEQEPGSNEDIKDFCQKNYKISFPMAAKISVKGKDMHPLYKYLTEEASKKGFEDPVKWNFSKFLIDEKGELVKVFSHKVQPMSEEVLKSIKN